MVRGSALVMIVMVAAWIFSLWQLQCPFHQHRAGHTFATSKVRRMLFMDDVADTEKSA
jgi:hypothetical protein